MTEGAEPIQKTPKRRWIGWVAGALFVGSLVYLGSRFAWAESLAVLRRMDPVWFGLGCVLPLFPYWGLRAVRWWWLLRIVGHEVSWWRAYWISALVLGVANFTPAQSGEALKVELLRRYANLGRSEGYGSFFIERVLDLYVLLGMGFLGAIGGLGLWSQSVTLFLGIGAVVATVVGGGLLWGVRLPGRAGAFLATVRGAVPSRWELLGLFGLTLVGWSLIALIWWSALRAVGVELAYVDAMMLLCGVTILSVISMVPGGLGVGEVALTEVLVQFGCPESLALAGALSVRCTALVGLIVAAVHGIAALGSRSSPSA